MPTLPCIHCGKDTRIKRTKKIRSALCPACQEEIRRWTVDLVDTEFKCERKTLENTPNGRKYCVDCELIFQ
jgi:hypothetical protein